MLQIVVIVLLACASVLGHPTKIIGGSEATSGQFPYVVALQSIINYRHMCGGALISDRIVISAAHCVNLTPDPYETLVYVGSIDNTKGGTRYTLSRVVIHEKYSSWRKVNDISLLQTSTPVELSATVQPIALPEIGQDVPDGTIVTALGWGSIEYPNEVDPDILHFVEVGIVGNEKCSELLESELQDTHICVGGVEGKGMCFGDSGSPLILGNTTVGIVSWGKPCGIGYPDVFTRVSEFVTWIQEKQAALEAE